MRSKKRKKGARIPFDATFSFLGGCTAAENNTHDNRRGETRNEILSDYNSDLPEEL